MNYLNPQANETLTEEIVRESIEDAINSSQNWRERAEFEGSLHTYNNAKEKEELVEAILNSANPERALAFALAWFKYPYNKETGIGAMKFLPIKRIISLIESFRVDNIEFGSSAGNQEWKDQFLQSIKEFGTQTAFFSDNPSINEFNEDRGYLVLRANSFLSMFIEEAYILNTERDPSIATPWPPKLVIPSFSRGLIDGAQRHYIQETIQAALVADMELDFWRFLKFVVSPIARGSNNTIGLSTIDEQIRLKENGQNLSGLGLEG